MKLKSQPKFDQKRIVVTLDAPLYDQLKLYATYANDVLGHHFDDERELAREVFRAFLTDDRGFKQWLAHDQLKNDRPVTVAAARSEKSPRVTMAPSNLTPNGTVTA